MADTYHTGKQLPVVITRHPSGAVELEPAVFASPHAQQAGVDLPKSGEIGKVTAPANNHQRLPHRAERSSSAKPGTAGNFVVNIAIYRAAGKSPLPESPFSV